MQRYILLAMLTAFACITTTVAQTVALKTNALSWATATPNIAVETRLSQRWTGELSIGYNPFPLDDHKTRKVRHIAAQPTFRYWTCDPFEGHFFSFNALYSHFNTGGIKIPFGIIPEFKDHRYQGDLAALGVGYGYSWILGIHWSLEAEVTVGVGHTWYRKYDCPHCGTYHGRETRFLVMPTKLAISIVYDI